MKRRIVALLLVLILILGALAACGEKQEEPKEPEKQEEPQKEPEKEPEPEPVEQGNNLPTTGNKEKNALTLSWPMPQTLDEAHLTTVYESGIVNMIADSLYRMDPEGAYHPWVASSIEPSEDGREVLITLRDDVTFRDGTTVNSDDVKFSYDHMRNAQGTQLPENSEFEKIDDLHFKIKFTTEGYVFDTMYEYIYKIIPCNSDYYYAKYDDPHQDLLFDVNYTGPYDLVSKDDATGTVVLKKYDKYWGDRGYIDTITLRAITGDVHMAFETGEIDYSLYSYDLVPTIEEYDNVNVVTQFRGTLYYLICNMASEKMQDIRVREALVYAFDRDEIAQLATGYAGITAWNLIGPNVTFYHDILPHRMMDKDKSRALMSEAGYSAADPCALTLLTTTHPDWVSTMQVLKEELDQCYFLCDISQSMDFTPYFTGSFDLGIIGINLGTAFQNFSMLYDPAAGLNLSQYAGDDLDQLVSEYATATTQEDADKAMLHEDSLFVHIPIAYSAEIFAITSDLDASNAFISGAWDWSLMKWK